MVKTLYVIKTNRGVMMGEDGRPLMFTKKQQADIWLQSHQLKAQVARCLINITELT